MPCLAPDESTSSHPATTRLSFSFWLPVLLLFLLGVVNGVAQSSTPSDGVPPDAPFREALNLGVSAYKAAEYDAAIEHFKAAVALDPSSILAHLYLGTAYSNQVVPGLDTPENSAMAAHAIENLRLVPQGNDLYVNALKQIAAIFFSLRHLSEARDTNLKVLEVSPADAETHYTIGVIDWQQAHANALDALAAQQLNDNGEGNPELRPSACLELHAKNSHLVEDGLDHLQRAIALRPTYDDAMAYLNLTYRRRADLACGNDAQRQADVTEAQRWMAEAIAARKQKAQTAVPRP